MARETNRFWFGDQWTMNCGGWHLQQKRRERNARGNAIACANPPALSPFASLGSRLFRVHTFTNAYLATLRVFPRLLFRPQSGHYRACGHNFEVSPTPKSDLLIGHPLARPLPAFQAQKVPNVEWTELRPNDSLVLAMVDVGFGQLNYLAVDFPRNTQIVRPFRPIDNFRSHQPTPLAVLIFEPLKGEINATIDKMRLKYGQNDDKKESEMFNLGEFMVENGMERGLIGLNWALIGGDAFGIERQRLRGMPDNCHSLVLHKLLRDRRWPFAHRFPLRTELSASLAVSLAVPSSSLFTCCFFSSVLCVRPIRPFPPLSLLSEDHSLFLDPLADFQIPSIAFRHSKPSVTSMCAVDVLKSDSLYQRSSRHYFAFREEHFALVLFDPSLLRLFWLVVDIPIEGLTAGGALGGIEVAKYVAPIPTQPGDCSFAVFMLFRQPSVEGKNGKSEMSDFFNLDHPLRQRQCQGQCSQREEFDIEQFKALHRLHLLAISWAKVCFDLFEASHQISLIRKNPEIREGVDRTSKLNGRGEGGGRSKKRTSAVGEQGDVRLNWNLERQHQIDAICAYFNGTHTDFPADNLRVSSPSLILHRKDELCVPSKSSLPSAFSIGIFLFPFLTISQKVIFLLFVHCL
ncbi:hypothetical protein niasHT_007923 [Heterodera trifolii]|uniref:Uncharacterized protein n=1 Tax=Heterodera trifolii TaxID=157864 RepID=A0ABD2LZF3_9BILA